MICKICGNKIIFKKHHRYVLPQTCGKECKNKLIGIKNAISLKGKKQSCETRIRRSNSQSKWWNRSNENEKSTRLRGFRNSAHSELRINNIRQTVKKQWDNYTKEEKDIRVKNALRNGWLKSESKIKSAKSNGSKNYGRNTLETLIKNGLRNLNIHYEEQIPIERDVLDSWGRKRYYFIDIGFPGIKLGIECDGKYWHKNKLNDDIRQKYIENLGWNIMRFGGSEIKSDLNHCLQKIIDRMAPVT